MIRHGRTEYQAVFVYEGALPLFICGETLASLTFCTPIEHSKQACLSSLRLNVPLSPLNMPFGMFSSPFANTLLIKVYRVKHPRHDGVQYIANNQATMRPVF